MEILWLELVQLSSWSKCSLWVQITCVIFITGMLE